MERLNKFLAHAGVDSRRHCDELIEAGRVQVNNEIIRNPGQRIDPEKDRISVDNNLVHAEKPVYWLVNKPHGYICTNADPDGRPRAIDLIPHVEQRVYVVGRLDEASEGLLLMTNDGELAHALTHPRYGVEKTYEALVAGIPTNEDMQKLLDGVWLSDGKVRAKSVKKFKRVGDSYWMKIVLSEGKNREIRRMLAQLGHKVLRLKRVAIGPIHMDRLPKAKSRRLTPIEVEALRKSVQPRKKPVDGKQKAVDG